ncbi:hypothetical protein Tco_0282798 [Tanacetum coccineum]
MRPIQVNTKFINHLQPKWSKFVTDVKLAKDLHNTNFDQLYAYLRQHGAHADEVHIMKERFLNPLALVANTYNSYPSYSNQNRYHQKLSPVASQQQVSPLASQQLYDVPMAQQRSYQALIANHSSVVHYQSYEAPDVHQPSQASIPLMDSGLVIPSFLPSNDPIASLNKAMAFISTVRQRLFVTTTVIEEGHIARQCTKPKRPRNSTWFKEKVMLAEALESGIGTDGILNR